MARGTPLIATVPTKVETGFGTVSREILSDTCTALLPGGTLPAGVELGLAVSVPDNGAPTRKDPLAVAPGKIF